MLRWQITLSADFFMCASAYGSLVPEQRADKKRDNIQSGP